MKDPPFTLRKSIPSFLTYFGMVIYENGIRSSYSADDYPFLLASQYVDRSSYLHTEVKFIWGDEYIIERFSIRENLIEYVYRLCLTKTK